MPQIPSLFRNRFEVDRAAPFRRHLNRLEVEIGREDYRHLKRVELVDQPLDESVFAAMEEITERLLRTTQNDYNRELLQRLCIRVYLDRERYRVFYRLPDRVLRFVPVWRERLLHRLFGRLPLVDSGWQAAGSALPGCTVRFLPDGGGGVLLVRGDAGGGRGAPLLTATHGAYDPHTLDVAFYLLRTGRAKAALINLGFSGREPLADGNLARLRSWGVPLNPSNIDVIFPYVDARDHPFCYKLEERFRTLVGLFEEAPPRLVIDLHGCVGTRRDDRRMVVGLGGMPPWVPLSDLGRGEVHGTGVRLLPRSDLRRGLNLLRVLTPEIFVQFCSGPARCYNLAFLGRRYLQGRCLDPARETASLLAGEERTYLPEDDLRWLPGAGGNALQRREARRLHREALCLHAEIPTVVRQELALRLRQLEIADSFESSQL